jgi:hypothetical protein
MRQTAMLIALLSLFIPSSASAQSMQSRSKSPEQSQQPKPDKPESKAKDVAALGLQFRKGGRR